MQQALYHPEHGYYSSGRCVIGREGDYFTNVSVGPLFGQLLAAQFAQMWERLGKMNNFVIVEQGAHHGQFARDVLDFIQKRVPEFFDALRYLIVEPFPILQELQDHTLKAFQRKLGWCSSMQPFKGVHFSNELLDAMPVRLVSDGVEKFVALDGDRFVFVERHVDEAIFNQAALQCIDDVAANLQRGYVIAIDYGLSEEKSHDCAQVRARHRNLDSPFDRIGEADITMNVDWRSIVERAQANGLRIAGFTDQHHFLTGLICRFANDDLGQSLLTDSPKTKRELQTLLHPEMLGRAFQVLALAKNVGPETNPLAGFKFARQPARAAEDTGPFS